MNQVTLRFRIVKDEVNIFNRIVEFYNTEWLPRVVTERTTYGKLLGYARALGARLEREEG